VSNKSTLRFFVVLLFAAFASAALVLADAAALGQNTNSSTTEESMQHGNMNANTSAPRRGRGRRGRRRTTPAAEPAAEPAAQMEVMTSTGQAAGAQDDDSRGDLSGERVDLSGTYTGNLSTSGGVDIGNGPATLTINGTSFTLSTEGGANHSGRIYAVLTRGATSAALYFADIQDPATSTPGVYNVRARKSGDRLTLSPAPQTKAKLWFGRGRR
jgi:hypothetical protein